MIDFKETGWLADILQSGKNKNEVLTDICQYLATNVEYYDWVGFYIADPLKRELNLGPYSGLPTEHINIPYGRGICGQAADVLDTIVVADVGDETNYLACSLDVKSEIVVPIFKNGQFVAELDIDSHRKNPFSENDKKFLEEICRTISGLF